MSSVYDCADPGSRQAGLLAAVDAVRRGELVVLPTDTVYGVGADAFDAAAVAALLAAKGRGRQMPPPVLVPDRRTVDGLAADVPEYARALMDRFWPGPLTLVLRAQPSLRWDLGDANGTVALRMPDHEVALELLRQTGPLAVSSANLTGRPTAATAAAAAAELGPAVAVCLDAGRSGGQPPSTIVDCTRAEPAVLRSGPIDEDQVRAAAATQGEPPQEPGPGPGSLGEAAAPV